MVKRKWEFRINLLDETRSGWTIYMYPAIYFEFDPETYDDQYDKYEGLSISFGIKFFTYNLYVYFYRRVNRIK